MAIIDARMQQKRGLRIDLDKNKMLPGEIAVPEDSDSIFVCTTPGNVLEIPSKQGMQTLLDALSSVVEQGEQIIEDFEKLEIEKVGINDEETNTLTTFSSSKIMQLIDAINEFSISIKDELPTEDIDTHTIYFIPKEGSEAGDVYDEYIYINDSWEHIGSTEIDLSNYYTTEQVDALKRELDEHIVKLQNKVDDFTPALISNYRDTGYDTLNINNEGYVQITTPSDLPNILSAKILSWYSGQPYGVTANGRYVMGKENSVIKSLIIRFYY